MSAAAASAPIIPVYAFNLAGDAIVLHEGQIGGLIADDVHGVVELIPRPKLGIEWSIDDDRGRHTNVREVNLVLRRPRGDVELPAWVRDFGEGWANGVTFGRIGAPIVR